MNTTPQWRKSSRSGGEGGQCVEVARFTADQWRKSSRSDGQGGQCVEVAGAECGCAAHARVIAVRDSKNPTGPALAFTPTEWTAFTDSVRANTHDLGQSF
ncbi:MAG: DUF397 domain-containing protein [Actinomadura sp.]